MSYAILLSLHYWGRHRALLQTSPCDITGAYSKI